MRHLILLIIFSLIISCSSYRSTFKEGYTSSLTNLFDSIKSKDKISIDDTSYWEKTYLLSNKGPIEFKLFIKSIGKYNYLLSIMKEDSVYFYRYRRE